MMTNRKRGYLYILLAAMLYSTTEVALKALGGAFAPMQVTVERVLLGALALLPFALKDLKKRGIHLTKSDWGYFALLGFLTVTLHMSLLQMAVLHMDASATSVIYSGNPVFALAAAHLILHEPLRKITCWRSAWRSSVSSSFSILQSLRSVSAAFWRSLLRRSFSRCTARSASCVSTGWAVW